MKIRMLFTGVTAVVIVLAAGDVVGAHHTYKRHGSKHQHHVYPESADAGDTYMEGERIPLHPTPNEDEHGWDCRFDGNRICGPTVHQGTGDDAGCVYYHNGTGTCRDRQGGRYHLSPGERRR